jgi:hypothetical protein
MSLARGCLIPYHIRLGGDAGLPQYQSLNKVIALESAPALPGCGTNYQGPPQHKNSEDALSS